MVRHLLYVTIFNRVVQRSSQEQILRFFIYFATGHGLRIRSDNENVMVSGNCRYYIAERGDPCVRARFVCITITATNVSDR